MKKHELPVRPHRRYRIRLRTVRQPDIWDGAFLEVPFRTRHLPLVYNEFVEFSWEELCDLSAAAFGKRMDTGILYDLIEATWVEVEGLTDQKEWEAVSRWRVEASQYANPDNSTKPDTAERCEQAQRLYYTEHYTQSQIAQRLGVNVRTVRRYLNKK